MVWMRSNEPEVYGLDSCRQVYDHSMGEVRILEYNPTTTELNVLGDWAIHRLTCIEVVSVRGAASVRWDVKAIIIWSRQVDRTWKFARAIVNSNSVNGREGYVYVNQRGAG